MDLVGVTASVIDDNNSRVHTMRPFSVQVNFNLLRHYNRFCHVVCA